MVLVPGLARAQDCAAASTQADMTRCAFADFEAAGAAQAAALRAVNERLPATQQPALRKAQRAYATFAAAQCDLEAAGSAGGSVQPMVRWQCMARLTRERATALQKLAVCPEGDVACAGKKP